MKSSSALHPAAPAPGDADASTRQRVAASVLEHGPSTALALADRLGLTPAAIRRHLDVLLSAGHVESREQRVYGSRGRGRPAKVFALTDTGRAQFYSAYDVLAIAALRFMAEHDGPDAVTRFAEARAAAVGDRFEARAADSDRPVQALADALSDEGYVASLQPSAIGDQLCQHHCPVAHVAEEFPQLCDAETAMFSRVLGVHVQRLATIAHGDGVCTTHVPRSSGPTHVPRSSGPTHVPRSSGPADVTRGNSIEPKPSGGTTSGPYALSSVHDPLSEESST